MTTEMLVPLSHNVYNKEVKLPRWNCRTTALRCGTDKVAAKLIKRFGPAWSKAEHAAIASYHQNRAVKLMAIWNAVVERASMETFNRPWRVSDYQVSGICRDEFHSRHKRVLRHCVHRANEHRDVARAHMLLARPGVPRSTTSAVNNESF